MAYYDWIGNFSYILIAISYMLTSMTWLRLIAVAGLAAEGLYFYLASTPPLWVGITWTLVFLMINVFQVTRLLTEKFSLQLSAEERLLHESAFTTLNTIQFHRMLRAGEWLLLPIDRVLTHINQPVGQLFILTSGIAAVMVNDTHVATIGPGGFVGDMSVLTGKPATATVIVKKEARAFAIDQAELAKLIEKFEDMRDPIHCALGVELLKKVISSRPQSVNT